jgi:hypothetical protein
MPITDDRTLNQNYPKPVSTNKLEDDVARLRAFMDSLDSDIKSNSTALGTKASLTHTHAISNITGLQVALDGKLSNAGFGTTGASLVAATTASAARSILGLGNFALLNSNGNANQVVKADGTFASLGPNDISGVAKLGVINSFGVEQTAPSWRIDAQSAVSLSGTNIISSVDASDYLQFDRPGNAWYFVISSAVRGGYNTTGVFGNGSQLTSLSASNLTGTVPDAAIPARIQKIAKYVPPGSHGYDCTDNGWYRLAVGCYDTPEGAGASTRAWLVHSITYDNATAGVLYCQQDWYDFTIATTSYAGHYRSSWINNVWTGQIRCFDYYPELATYFEPKRTRFYSGQYSYSNGGYVTISHGLGVVPFATSVFLQCIVADATFVAGHMLVLGGTNAANGSYGITTLIDASNVYVHFGASGLAPIGWGSTTGVSLDPTKWRVVAQCQS